MMTRAKKIRVFDTSERAYLLRRWFLHVDRTHNHPRGFAASVYTAIGQKAREAVQAWAEEYFLTNPAGLDETN